MNTSIKHDKNDLVIYIGLGGSKALLLYPFWSFNDRGKGGSFSHFDVPRGEGAHLGLFGFHWLSKPCRTRAVKPEGTDEMLPNFIEPLEHATAHTD